MFFPYSTDAPVYYWPVGTVGLIVANLAVFVGVNLGLATGVPGLDDPWLLVYGDGLDPAQWFCSIFAHASFEHLLGNMLFLWVFGLVVEGKVGALRFLTIYLLIGGVESAVEQTLMLSASGGVSLGASAAIFGVMAVAAVWAPDNGISFAYLWILVYRHGSGSIDFPVLAVASFYIGWDLFWVMVLSGMGGNVGGGLLHLLGAAIGLPIGVFAVKAKLVDCEGWDFFTRYGWNQKQLEQEAKAEAAAKERRAEKANRRESDTLAAAFEQIDVYLAADNVNAAAKLQQKMAKVGDGLRLEAPTLRKLIAGLQAQQRWAELAPLMVELIDRSPETADVMRVQLAQVCVAKLERPGRALELLGQVQAESLNEKQLMTAKRVAMKAREMQQEGLVELDDGGW